MTLLTAGTKCKNKVSLVSVCVHVHETANHSALTVFVCPVVCGKTAEVERDDDDLERRGSANSGQLVGTRDRQTNRGTVS